MPGLRVLAAIAVVFFPMSAKSFGQLAAAGTAKPTGPPVVGGLPNNINARAEKLVSERQALIFELREVSGEATAKVKELLPDYKIISDEAARAGVADEMTAAVRRLAQIQVMRHELGGRRNVLMVATGANLAEGFTFVENSQWNASLLTALGDAAGAKMLAEYACFDPRVADFAGELMRVDDAERGRLVKGLSEQLKDTPFDEMIADEAVIVMKRRLGADEDRQKLFSIMEELGPGCAPAVRLLVQTTQAFEKFDRTQKLIGTREFKLTGTLVDGTPFDSDSLVGKVVIVDFWATWCGPCVNELPRLSKLLEEHQEEGLAIVGVNNDYDIQALQGFLKRHPDVSWPQLFDTSSAANSEKHVLTQNSGIQGIPALFVLDRRGVLRSVTARETLEQTVAELLREPVEGGQP